MKNLRELTIIVAAFTLLALGCGKEDNPTQPSLSDKSGVSGLAKIPLAADQGDDIEPNDNCPTAQDLGTVMLPFVLSGSLEESPFPNGDVDFFKFAGTQGTLVRVDLKGQSTGKGTLGDPFLGFFNSDCNLIAINDDNGVNFNSRLVIAIPADNEAIASPTSVKR